MRDGHFQLKSKSENAVELDTELIVAAEIYHGDLGDTTTIEDTVNTAQVYIPEPHRSSKRKRKAKPRSAESSYRRNRRNVSGKRGRQLQRKRSERVEHTFAHLCNTGGSRRTRLRGIEDVRKRFMSAAMAYNLGRITLADRRGNSGSPNEHISTRC